MKKQSNKKIDLNAAEASALLTALEFYLDGMADEVDSEDEEDPHAAAYSLVELLHSRIDAKFHA